MFMRDCDKLRHTIARVNDVEVRISDVIERMNNMKEDNLIDKDFIPWDIIDMLWKIDEKLRGSLADLVIELDKNNCIEIEV